MNNKLSELQKLTSPDAESSDLFFILDRNADGTGYPQTKAMEFGEMTEFFNSSSAGIVNVLSASFVDHIAEYSTLSASYSQTSGSVVNELKNKINNSATGSYISYGIPVLNSFGKIYDAFLPATTLPVTSIFGRSGSVIATGSDYSSFYIQKSGDTMVGNLNVLISPTSPSHSVSKLYVDNISSSISSSIYSISSSINNRINQISSSIGTGVEQTSGFKNYIINGNYSIWQRTGSYTSVSPISEYVSDRWLLDADFTGGSSLTISKQDNTLYTDLPVTSRNFIRIQTPATISVVGDQYISMRHHIEGVTALWGKTVTVSYYARASINNAKLGIHFDYGYGAGGTGGADSGGTWDYGINRVDHISLSTTWTKYTHSIVLPTFSTRTFTKLEDTFTAISFNIATSGVHTINDNYSSDVQPTANCNYDIAQVQLEEGSTATEFEYRNSQIETSMCQRYFCKSYNPDVYPGTITLEGVNSFFCSEGGTNALYSTIRFPVNMRTIPSVTAYSHVSGLINTVLKGGVDQTASYSRIGNSSAFVGSADTGLALSVSYHFTADADF